MIAAWITALQQADAAGDAAVLVTVAAVRGSAPREAGAKMVVTADAAHGTIGGGRLELECITEGRMMLQGAAGPVLREFPLGPALGQCCGGSVSVLFEVVAPPAWRVAVFGAGHVGREVVGLLGGLPCQLRWVDSRAGLLRDHPARVTPILAEDPAAEIARLTPGSFVLVMTHDHQLDFAIVAAALARKDLTVGLIGSDTKRARFASRLRALGLDPAPLICPIGLPGVGGKLAAEIAISVVAQLLHLRDESADNPQRLAENPKLIHAECDPACGACQTVRA